MKSSSDRKNSAMATTNATKNEQKLKTKKNKEEQALIERIIREGHELAEAMRVAKSLKEIEALQTSYDGYTNFVNDHFSTEENAFGKVWISLTMSLSIAFAWRIDSWRPPIRKDAKAMAESSLRNFEKELDKREWAKKTKRSTDVEENPEGLRKQILADRVVKEGHKLAKVIREAKSIYEIESLQVWVRDYSDSVVDKHFGVVDDWDGSKCSSLTTSLSIAFNWNIERWRIPEREDIKPLADSFLRGFEIELDEREWMEDFDPGDTDA